jgi:hypothetical protein
MRYPMDSTRGETDVNRNVNKWKHLVETIVYSSSYEGFPSVGREKLSEPQGHLPLRRSRLPRTKRHGLTES